MIAMLVGTGFGTTSITYFQQVCEGSLPASRVWIRLSLSLEGCVGWPCWLKN